MKTKVKLCVSFILILVICAIAAVPAFAIEAKDFYLSDLKMKISVDDSFSVFTRDTPSSDPVFDELDINYENTMQSLRGSGVYLQGISTDGGYMLTVNMSEDENSQAVMSYGRLNDEERESIKENFMTNSIYTAANIEEINGRYYFALLFTDAQSEQTIYGMQYNTVENGMNINITLQTAVAPLASNTTWIIEDAVKSIEFMEKSESVSSFKPLSVVIALIIVTIVVIAALVFLSAFLRKKKISVGSQGGFDNPKTNVLYKLTSKRDEEKRAAKERNRIKTRQKMIDNIDNGDDYDVFSDKQSVLSTPDINPKALINKLKNNKKDKKKNNRKAEK